MAFDPSRVPSGVYRIYWASGEYSLGTVYIDRSGFRWLAPSNWIRPGVLSAEGWAGVERLEPLVDAVPPPDDWYVSGVYDSGDGRWYCSLVRTNVGIVHGSGATEGGARDDANRQAIAMEAREGGDGETRLHPEDDSAGPKDIAQNGGVGSRAKGPGGGGNISPTTEETNASQFTGPRTGQRG